MNRLKTVFLGTPEFSVPTLDLLFNHSQIDLKYIVTMPDRPKGRGQNLSSPPVADFAKKNKIALHQTANINDNPNFIETLEKLEIDLIIVLAFAQFLKKRILLLPRLGCFNIHTSLLPKYRGAGPIQHALLNGDLETGVSIQKMVKKMDAGDIVFSEKININPNEKSAQLTTRLKYLSALSVNSFIDTIDKNKLKFHTQNENDATYAPVIRKSDGLINFKDSTYQEIINKSRAYMGWPGIFCFLDGKRLKILDFIKDEKTLAPGETDLSNGAILVGCKDATLRLCRIQIEGKSVTSDSELVASFKNKYKELLDSIKIHN